MEFIVDSAVLIRHNSGLRIAGHAKRVLREADRGDHIVFIPIIVAMEIMYLAEKHRINYSLKDLQALLKSTKNYQIVDLDLEILIIAEGLANYDLELHDRLIVATAVNAHLPLLTSDKNLRRLDLVKTIWA